MAGAAASGLGAALGCDQAANRVDLPIPEVGFLFARPALAFVEQRPGLFDGAACDDLTSR
jgi:hypothetical protein